ncbi:hypothetical protein ACF053_27670 [Streptomyces kanasensis]|uniref:hypothetical protein n=1 Tax=Streptomyces kanasensis TaxID=936756 RepID=UPI0036F6F535
MGLASGSLLIWSTTWYEQVAYAHDVRWAVLVALCGGAALGLAAWAVTGAEYSLIGWAMALVVAVHVVTGTLTAERQALHDRGLEVTATVRKEQVHRLSGSGGVEVGPTYTYDLAVRGDHPHRHLDAGTTRLTVGERVLVTIDPDARAPSRLGHRPDVGPIPAWILGTCNVLFLLITVGLSIGVGRSRPSPSARRPVSWHQRRGPGATLRSPSPTVPPKQRPYW